MKTERNKLSIVVRESEKTTENTAQGEYTVYSSEYLSTAIHYAHEHGFPIDFYVNYNVVSQNEFHKALAENVEFDERENNKTFIEEYVECTE